MSRGDARERNDGRMASAKARQQRRCPSSRTIARLRLWLVIVVASIIIGMAYWSVLAAVYDLDDQTAVLVHGGQYGAIIGSGLGLFQVVFMASTISLPLRRAPFLSGLLVRTAVAALIIFAALVFCRLVFESPVDRTVLDPFNLARDTAFSVAVYVTISFVVMMQRMIGGRVLRNFVMGRYHRPVREERAFLFLDLADSTALTQRLGDIGVHALISRVFFDIDEVILRHGGEVHRYIGDEVVVTWPLADCRDDGQCLSCYPAIQTLIAERAAEYRATFGVVPEFRAGLHGGPVVAGECGDSKQEIVFFGDTINTAARLRSACKDLGVQFLVSQDLVQAIHAPPAVPLQPCGRIRLAGRCEETQVFTWKPGKAFAA
jgi:adenylate cyclase